MDTKKNHTPEDIFGGEIKRLRMEHGYSQEDLAFAADIHPSYVSQLERGIKSPTLDVILRLASALRTPAHEIIRAVQLQLS